MEHGFDSRRRYQKPKWQNSYVEYATFLLKEHKMAKITLAKLLKRISIAMHPYRKSPNAPIYEDIAEMCGTTADRVYKIAHGSHIHNYEDSATLTELKRRGIVRD